MRFGAACERGAVCEQIAVELATNALVMFEMDRHKLRIDRDGKVFVDGTPRESLSASELQRLREQLEAAEPMPVAQDQQSVAIVIPKNGELTLVEGKFDSVAGARIVAPFLRRNSAR